MAAAVKTGEIVLDKRSRDLPRPVGPEVHEYDDVAVLDFDRRLPLRHDRGGFDELVRLAPLVCPLEGLAGARDAILRLSVREEIVGRLNPWPAVIAVHAVVASHNGRETPAAQVLEFLLHGLNGA